MLQTLKLAVFDVSEDTATIVASRTRPDRSADCCKIIKEEFGGIGPEGVVALSGTGRNAMWQGAMVLRTAFGSPNMSFDAVLSPTHVPFFQRRIRSLRIKPTLG